MTTEAPAKFNPVLRVLGPRADGYHEVALRLLRLRLTDTVEVAVGGAAGIRLHVEVPPEAAIRGGAAAVPPGPDNLCVRAARLLCEELDRPPALDIRLTKRIPVGAGLGGGSSDAAAVLVLLDRLFGASLDASALAGLGVRLGSDVPFFTLDTPYAAARGRGERLRPLAPPPSRPVLVLVPPFAVSAADAYRWWQEDQDNAPAAGPSAARQENEDALDTIGAAADWAALEAAPMNDLAPPVERRHPVLADARRGLEDAGAAIALLSGSGSCVVGVFRTEPERDAAREALERRVGGPPDAAPGPGWRILATATDQGGPGG